MTKYITLKTIPIFSLLLSSLSFTTIACTTGGTLLMEGTKAPDFTAQTQDGSTIRLRDYFGKQNVILYFYPKDDTPGCTKEACGFRDILSEIKKYDAVVFGVSTDDQESHGEFSQKYNLNFPLLVDKDKSICKLYGVPLSFGFAKRVTFIIGKDGMIKKVYPTVSAAVHVKEILADLQKL